jgi:hypothetical protein
MSRGSRLVFLLVVAAALACLHRHSGVRITPEQRTLLVEGRTTVPEVVRAWGEPTGTTKRSDGTVTLVYALRTVHEVIVPTHVEVDALVLTFGPDGVLLRWQDEHVRP